MIRLPFRLETFLRLTAHSHASVTGKVRICIKAVRLMCHLQACMISTLTSSGFICKDPVSDGIPREAQKDCWHREGISITKVCMKWMVCHNISSQNRLWRAWRGMWIMRNLWKRLELPKKKSGMLIATEMPKPTNLPSAFLAVNLG